MKELTINIESLLKSSLTPDQFIICLLIHKKEFKAVERLVVRLFGISDTYVGEIYWMLQEGGWIKINGPKAPQDCEVRQKFLELLNDSTDMNIASWVEEYRELFRGKRPGATGDKELCIKHLTKILTEHSDVTKEDILKATKYYVSTCAKDHYKYLMQSNYFLSKTDTSAGEVKHPILAYLEETKDELFSEPKDFTTSI